jgi:xanthine dehydrogenase FAD-binding subunit
MIGPDSFFIPGSLKEALEIRQEFDAIPLAGGTDLMVKYRSTAGISAHLPIPVVSISHLPELKGIDIDNETLIIGSGVTLTELLFSAECPGILKEAIRTIGAPGIRNMATLGGNICNASPAGDTIPVLYCLDAHIQTSSVSGPNDIPIEEFILGPGKVALGKNALVTHIVIPFSPFAGPTELPDRGESLHFKKVGTRRANALSKLSVTFLSHIEGNTIRDLRIALGAVAPMVVRERKLENKLIGLEIEKAEMLFPGVIDEYEKLAIPIDDQRSTRRYRKNTALKLVEYYLKKLGC